ncbi:preprotein translocase subunit SecA [Litorisediminicola beolgyonensis]|uniref:Protein translocase subunit SecA n=1 Tax=Litorisediminicola beolgyonensis TaxID=1173614 RepID=A0ABW3ZDP6_9RHOB
MSEAGSLRRLLPAPVPMAARSERKPNWLDRVEHVVTALPARLATRITRQRLTRQAHDIVARSAPLADLDRAALDARIASARDRLRRAGLDDAEALADALAAIRELSGRTLGLRHYPCQVLGGLTLLSGRIAEMDTGEGKTLTATLAAGAAGLAGVPTHVVTVNDYLAERDADLMRPLYAALGLTVGVITAGLTPEERRAAYAADITYCSNSELAFDYLRDRVALGRDGGALRMKVDALCGAGWAGRGVVMRGLHFAVVDEADSILIDEARTPLIIAQETEAEDEWRWAEAAYALADRLDEGRHFRVEHDRRAVELLEAGRARLADLGAERGGLWAGRVRREESVRQALTARHLFHRGDHYLVRDGEVQIVDEYTGRVLAGRSWNDGLHQLIELKEGVEVTGRKTTLAKTSFQRFFRRYKRLGGMTGTAREVKDELRAVYRLDVLRVPPHRRSRRVFLPGRVLPGLEAKREAIADAAAALADAGRPVLIGTRSVAASAALSDVLTARGLSHQVLNAEAEAEEAEIIARAGEAGRITIATNMAGRGVDIALGPGVLDAGGLHVILSERHDAGRIDRQLFGRCARQGDAGSVETLLSREDPLLDILRRRGRSASPMLATALRLAPGWVFNRAQRRAERLHSRIRKDLLRADEQTAANLAFAGDAE